MSRVRGGYRGLLAAFDAGIADELSAAEPHDAPARPRRLSKAEVREARRREDRRLAEHAKRKALAARPPY